MVKRIFLMILICLVTVITACESSSGSNPPEQKSVVSAENNTDTSEKQVPEISTKTTSIPNFTAPFIENTRIYRNNYDGYVKRNTLYYVTLLQSIQSYVDQGDIRLQSVDLDPERSDLISQIKAGTVKKSDDQEHSFIGYVTDEFPILFQQDQKELHLNQLWMFIEHNGIILMCEDSTNGWSQYLIEDSYVKFEAEQVMTAVDRMVDGSYGNLILNDDHHHDE